VTITKRPDAYGLGGTSLIASEPGDVARLPKAARRLISDATIDLFVRHPESMEQRAEAATFGPLRRWLSQVAETACTLEVHRPHGLAPSVMLRFQRAGRALTPALVQSAGGPPATNVWIREVDALVGGINLAYASAGFLILPEERSSARALVERTESLLEPEMRDAAFYGRSESYPAGVLDDATSLWQSDGDVLFYTSRDRTFWLGCEQYTGAPGTDWGSIEEALTRLFTSLARDERFAPG
jgi:hypothetical protein